jgi:Smg protein
MKDSLFDLLLDLFEKTIAQLKERYPSLLENERDNANESQVVSSSDKKTTLHVAMLRSAGESAFRVFTPDERMRLTKASYQLLQRLNAWDIVKPDMMELILNRLMFSESRFIQLHETKWVVRSTLATLLDTEQLAFLDLVLYQKEHGFAVN